MSLFGSGYHEGHAAERRQRDADAAEGARIRKIREQGDPLIRLSEATAAIRERYCDTSQGILCSDFREAADFLERRFGGNEGERVMNAREYEQRYEAERAALASQHDNGAAEALSRCLELDVECMAYCYGGLAIVNIAESLADLAEQGWRLRREAPDDE